MKKLIKRILFFFVGFLILAFPIDIIISKAMRDVYIISSENEVWSDIYNKKVTYPCLIYGSSRAKVHIDPMILEENTGVSAYNFGSDGQPFPIIKVKHDINKKINGTPKYIIHSLDAFAFTMPQELFNSTQFLPYLLWNIDMIKGVSVAKEGFTYLDYFMPLARFYGQYDLLKKTAQQQMTPDNKKLRIKGYSQETRNWNNDLDKAKEEMEYFRATVDSDACDMYEDFIKECKANGTKLALVYTPEHIDGQEFIINRDSVIAIYENYSKRYDLPFFNYTTDSICYDKYYFYNSMHLNRRGSVKITTQLSEDLSKIGFFNE